jgi:outer membrane protein OmpA-like peptidoglycan-associated protein
MRNATKTRSLKPGEINLAREVFHSSLPTWNTIGITNGLGSDDTVWTIEKSLVPFLSSMSGVPEYLINFGDAADLDLSAPGVGLSRYVPGYGSHLVHVIFMHEMTHVWQYARGNAAKVALRCVYAQQFGSGDKFTAGDSWSDYNLEQRAGIVEQWVRNGKKETDEVFPYIHYLIRQEGQYTGDIKSGLDSMDLSQLQVLLDGERGGFGTEKQPEPIRVSSNDNSFLVVLSGDVLFDIAKSDLKPAADGPLEQAWAKIKTNPNRNAIFVNGYTDSTGDDGFNMDLSMKRAEAVAKWFIRKGYLASTDMKRQGFGKANPVAPNTTREGRARNRRVEIYLRNK